MKLLGDRKLTVAPNPDPLICPRCQTPLEIRPLTEDAGVQASCPNACAWSRRDREFILAAADEHGL